MPILNSINILISFSCRYLSQYIGWKPDINSNIKETLSIEEKEVLPDDDISEFMLVPVHNTFYKELEFCTCIDYYLK